MIRILAREHTLAVAAVCAQLDKEMAQYDVYLSQSPKMLSARLSLLKGNTLILIGDVGRWCTTFAETFGLNLVYDTFAEKNIKEYCKRTGAPVPAQYTLDRYCVLPETFIHYASVFGMQCACGGEFDKCNVYILPDDNRECDLVFDNYIAKDLFKVRLNTPTYCFKAFGLSKGDLGDKLEKFNCKIAEVHFETVNLDSKITLTFPSNCAKKLITDTLDSFLAAFGTYIYANSDLTLPQAVVSMLNERYQTLATAESITGGLIASSLVDVPGASSVLYEGAVTYTIDSKCKRLGLNPHFIDEYGVVSSQVAKEMAAAQLANADYSVSTTGFAGPTSDGTNPVGLCFIGVGSKRGGQSQVKVFKNVFHGDRNSIRSQVANTALFLLISAIKN